MLNRLCRVIVIHLYFINYMLVCLSISVGLSGWHTLYISICINLYIYVYIPTYLYIWPRYIRPHTKIMKFIDVGISQLALYIIQFGHQNTQIMTHVTH